MGDVNCTDLISFFWDLAKFVLVAGSQGAKERQLVIFTIVDSKKLSCYVYIHEYEISQNAALLYTFGLACGAP